MSEINNLNLLGTTYDIVDDSAIHERADWTETNTSSDAYIAHKPENLVQDANYVHTDNNYTTAEKTKLADLENGKSKTLTSADYNYPVNNPDGVAMWKVPSGVYTNTNGTQVYLDNGSASSSPISMVVAHQENGNTSIIYSETRGGSNDYPLAGRLVNQAGQEVQVLKPIAINKIVNNLTTTTSGYVLDARQGKALKDLIDSTVADEATARQAADTGLQTQIDAIVASSDVKDIVGTKADLSNYDTSTLGNNDIIKVLQDESQNSQTTYYRWSTSTSTFTLIGAEGPYYTKSATDTLLNDKADKSTTYTKTETDTLLNAKQGTLTAGSNIQISNDTISATDTTYSAFTGTDGTAAGTAGLVPAPATTDAGKFLKADGTWDTAGGGGPTVVQTPGTATTTVMSQNAVTSMVFADPSIRDAVRIGNTKTVYAGSVGIGRMSGSLPTGASGSFSIAIGSDVSADTRGAVGIGKEANIIGIASGAIALGACSKATRAGEMNIGSTNTSYGYNSSNYRLLTGLYDPQSAHDAANKEYVDTSVTGKADITYVDAQLDGKQDELTAGTGITITDESGALVISATAAEPDTFTTNEWNALWA